MFNKKDPLIDSVKKVMEENQIRREVEQALNEQLGIQTKKQLPFQKHAEYDAMLAEAIQEALKGNQHKIDANKNNKIDSHDFKLLRAKKETKPEEHGVEAERSMAAKGKKMYEQSADDDEEDSPERDNEYADELAATLKRRGDNNLKVRKASQDAYNSELENDLEQELKGQDYVERKQKLINRRQKQQWGLNPDDYHSGIDEGSYSAKSARAGKDIGKKGKMFAKIAASAAKKYNSKERGQKVAGAVLKKLRSVKEESDVDRYGTHDIQFADKPGQTFKALGKNKDDLSSFNDKMKEPSSISFPNEPDKKYYRDTETGDYSAQRDSRSSKEPSGASLSAGPKSIQFPGSATTYTRNASNEYEGPKSSSSEKPKYQSSIYPDDATKDPSNVEKPRSSGATYNPQAKRTTSSIRKALAPSSQVNVDRRLEEKALSKAQHRFFGLVRGIQKGEAKGSPKAEKAAKEMSVKSVRDYAKTKEAGLPEKVEKK